MAGHLKIGLALLGAVCACGAIATVAGAETINVFVNQAKIVKLPKPADTIVIGNSEIADATVQDARTVVLTGKGFGTTNLVVFDADGKVVLDSQLSVSRLTENSVRVYRPGQIQTLSCSPYCEASFKTEAERQSDTEMAR
jgi:Flp pilus assembly secretin CpaC